MSTFRLVIPLLRELDRQGVAEFGAGWDAAVASSIRGLQDRYSQLRNRNRKLIDYSSLPVQMAYAFMYVSSHGDFLAQILKRAAAEITQPLLSGRNISVTSLGGGPGSDLLALVSFIREMPAADRPKKVVYRVLDKQPNWHQSLVILAEVQKASVAVEVIFERIDVTVEEDWIGSSLDCDDYVIMNYFVSEVCALRNSSSVVGCFNRLLGSMKSGAVLVYNDSSAYSFYTFFDQRVRSMGGFQAIISEQANLFVTDYDVDDFYRDFIVRFDRDPKLHSSAVFRVLRKQ